MKKKKYLPLYFKWIMAGKMPYRETKITAGGLCSLFPGDPLLDLCLPDDGTSYYCGFSDEDWFNNLDSETAFTSLRQNILLLMAALNGEL